MEAYRCYYLAKQDGESVQSLFKVGDGMISESFNVEAGKHHGMANHFYWRRVVAVSETPVLIENGEDEEKETNGNMYHWVDLSVTDCAANSEIPAVTDTIVQLGNKNETVRQNAIIISSVDMNSPSILLYHGVKDFTLSGHEYVSIGFNPSTGHADVKIYGDFYVGGRPDPETGEANSYAKYDREQQKVKIKGELEVGSTLDGKDIKGLIDESSYLKEALQEDMATTIKNGLILSGLIQLKNAQGSIMSGLNGMTPKELASGASPIAFWAGGAMKDKELCPDDADAAKVLIRMDGTGYFAGGAITINKDGAIHFNLNNITYGDKNGTLGETISLWAKNADDKSGKSMVPIADVQMGGYVFLDKIRIGKNDTDYVELEYKDGALRVSKGLWSEEFITALGSGSGGSSGGGGALGDIVDVSLSNPTNGQILIYNGSHWVNKTLDMSSLLSSVTVKLGNTPYMSVDGVVSLPAYPTALKNPNALKFGSKTYDGSAAATIIAADLGALTAHQTLYTLTLQRNGTSVGTFKPTANATLNINAATSITVPAGLSAAALTAGGVIAITYASGYAIPTTAKQGNWDKVYNWYAGITAADTDGIINKWGEIISFLDGISDTSTLGGLINGVNTNIGKKADRIIQISAGTGLTGGGDLSANRTINVVSANDGITVNADNIQLNIVNALNSTSTTRALSAAQGKKVWDFITDLFEKVNIGTSSAPVWAIRVKYGLYTEEFITCLGQGSGGSGGGTAYDRLDTWSAYDSDKSGYVLSAALGYDLHTRVRALETAPTVTWANITGRPSWIGATKPTYTFAEITSKPTTLGGYGIVDGVNTVTINGSGNAVTAAAVSGHSLTLTKGATFLTSHQSLANYVTLNTVQTISGAKTFSGVIKSSILSNTWVAGIKDAAAINLTGSGYVGWINGKSKDGRLGISSWTNDNNLNFLYQTQATIDAGTNTTTHKMTWDGANDILTAGTFKGKLDWGYITSKPTTLSGYGITDAPTKTGGGASGTWGISISGNAATATKATSATTAADAAFLKLNPTGRPTSANIAPSAALSKMQYFIATSSMTSGKPAYDGYILQFNWDNANWGAQLAVLSGATPGLQIRTSENKADWAGRTWRTVITEDNLASYGSLLDGRYYTESEINAKLTNGSVTKVGTATVGGTGKPIYLNAGKPTALSATAGSASLPVYLNGGTITACTAASVFSNLSNSGNNLSITVAGQNRMLTVGYASNADKIDGMHANGLFTAFGNSGNNITATIGGTTKAFQVNAANFLVSRGNVAPQTGRIQAYGNVYSYNTILGASSVGAPVTYTSVIGFGRGAAGTVEIAGGWTEGMGLWYRALRDTIDNWYEWKKVVDETTIGSLNAGSATKLQNARTIWGQSFNGTGNVSGALTGVTNITASGRISCTTFDTVRSIESISGIGIECLMGELSINTNGYDIVIEDDANFCFGRDTNNMIYGQDDQFYFYTPSQFYFDGSEIFANNGIRSRSYITAMSTSDLRLKTVFPQKVDYRARLLSLGDVFEFRYNGISGEDMTKVHTGLAWQRVKKVLPDMALTRDNGYGALNYISPEYINLICGAVQQNIKQTNNHEARIKALEEENRKLRKEIRKLNIA